MQHDSSPALPQACNCAVSCGCDAADQGCLCSGRNAPTPTSAKPGRRALIWLASSLVMLGALGACSAFMPKNLDYAAVRPSERGAYRVSYKSDTTPIPINRLHTWTLHVESPDGRPVTDATVKVDGDMPQHMHGLPTRPRVTRNLGNGDYLVEGIKFQMGGWWVMEFGVTSGERTDVAKFNLLLQQ